MERWRGILKTCVYVTLLVPVLLISAIIALAGSDMNEEELSFLDELISMAGAKQANILNIIQATSSFSFKESEVQKQNKKIVFVDGAIIKVKVAAAEVAAEVAKSDAKKHAGLEGREKLDAGEGMLFVFDRPGNYSFWNKGMNFMIDIIWIKDDVVVNISENMPDFKTSPDYTVTRRAEAVFVLETTSGFIANNGIKLGDHVQWEN